MVDLQLYGVCVTNVHPVQLITVMDCKESANSLADFLDDDNVEVKEVDDFYPPGMVDADIAWLNAYKEWRSTQ